MAESGRRAASVRLGTLAAIAVAWVSPLIQVRTDAVFLLVAAAIAWQAREFGWRDWDRPLVAAAAALVAAHGVAAFVNQGSLALPRIARPLLVLVLMAHLRVGPAVGAAIAGSAACWSLVGLAAWALFHLGLIPAGSLVQPNSANLPGVARVSGVLSSNSLVLYLGLVVPWLLRGRWAANRPRARLAALGLVLVAACGTLSRGLVSVFLALWPTPAPGSPALVGALSRAARVLAVGGLLALLPVTWWAIAPVGPGARRATSLDAAPLGVRENAYAVLHRASWRLWLENPITGHGPGTFPSAYARVTGAGERAACWPSLSVRGMDPHSLLLGALSETGLLGLAGWLAVTAVVLRRLFGAAAGSLPRAMGVAVLGLAVAGLHMDFQSLRCLWALVGLGLAAARHGEPC